VAQIMPLDIIAPGAWGLNTEATTTLMPPQWATKAHNAVVNREGRIASRLGWADQTTNAVAGTHTIDVMHEYLDEAGASVIISAANNKIYKNITDFTDAANDITSSTAPTADHWQFVNFNNKVLGFQRGQVPIVRTSGDFADASYTGTGPDGNCAVSAFGRVWAADADLQTIRYSALLDDTDYSTASGGGTIDMSSVWTNGMDEIVAIAVIGATLVVFGKNHIVMWADGSGSEIGITASQIEVVDTIEGTGCIARDSVQNTAEGDLMFLSRHGVQSLGRVIQEKSNPLVTLTMKVRAKLQADIARQLASDANFDQVRATVSPEEGLYILNFPVPNIQYVIDGGHPYQDPATGESFAPITTWTLGGNIGALMTTTTGITYLGSAGVVGKYSTKGDNAVLYAFAFETGWLDFGPEVNHRIKMLKEILASVVIGVGTVAWVWEYDFTGVRNSRSISYTVDNLAEYNIAEYNIGEFSGGVTVQRKPIAAFGEGQFIKLGATADVLNFELAIQHMSLAPKIGRLVT
jgi:hypothetical protein